MKKPKGGIMSDDSTKTVLRSDLLRLTTDIVSAYLGGNRVQREDLSTLINSTYAALETLGNGSESSKSTNFKPAIPVRRSVTPDFLICLEDGRKLKMLKRHLRTSFGMTPDEYRSKWNLPNDYPMVAPNYAKRRSDFAKQIGLGRKPS
jgi:predicted transcriptional regulator